MLIRFILLVGLLAVAPAAVSPLDTGSCIDPMGQPCVERGGEMDPNG
ncbi:MAG TPA: hypothetical protein VF608_01745 [Thermoanaerobaculia bacterium]